MTDKILEAIRSCKMFCRGDRVLAAVSGGADSVALLHALYTLRLKLGIRLGALHLNHKLRGEESERDERFVRSLCRSLGVPLKVASANVSGYARARGKSVETAARELRYSFFGDMAGKYDALVATAHTQNDSAETLLFNLARGTALRGLCGIPAVRGYVRRPLTGCTRAEVESYCENHGLDYVTDSSNSSDLYARNRIRHELLPLLIRENPRFLERQAEMCELLRRDADFLDSLARDAYVNLLKPDGSLNRAEFLALAPALRGRVLALLLRRSGADVSAASVKRLEGIITAGKGSVQLSPRYYFTCRNQDFALEEKKTERAFFPISIPLEKWDGARQVEVYPSKTVFLCQSSLIIVNNYLFDGKAFNNSLDYDKIKGIITLRQRLPADRIKPVGRGCTKTLKNLFQEAGIPAPERSRRIVLADENGALWVEGFPPHERAAVEPSTRRILTIHVVED